jgi:hypothetical protein
VARFIHQSLVPAVGIIASAALAGCAGDSARRETPTLGRVAGAFVNGAQGFGKIRPSVISNGGSPSGTVTNIHWDSWGDPRAVGTGTGWIPPGFQTDPDGSFEQATVVAFDLGDCDGRPMYRAVQWFYPSRGDSFDPRTYQDICRGDYVE